MGPDGAVRFPGCVRAVARAGPRPGFRGDRHVEADGHGLAGRADGQTLDEVVSIRAERFSWLVSRGTYPHGASGSDGAGRLNGHPKKCWVRSRWPPARAGGNRPPVSRPTSWNVPAREGVSGVPTAPCVRCLRGVARSRPAAGSRCRGSPRAECFLRASAPRSLAVPGIRHRIRNVRLFAEAASVRHGAASKVGKICNETCFLPLHSAQRALSPEGVRHSGDAARRCHVRPGRRPAQSPRSRSGQYARLIRPASTAS